AAGLEAAAARQPEFPLIAAGALRARALIDGDADLAIEAADLHQHDQRILIRADALEDAGRLLPPGRRDDAVDCLDAALSLYASAGAGQDAARVRALLRSAGVRRSR